MQSIESIFTWCYFVSFIVYNFADIWIAIAPPTKEKILIYNKKLPLYATLKKRCNNHEKASTPHEKNVILLKNP